MLSFDKIERILYSYSRVGENMDNRQLDNESLSMVNRHHQKAKEELAMSLQQVRAKSVGKDRPRIPIQKANMTLLNQKITNLGKTLKSGIQIKDEGVFLTNEVLKAASTAFVAIAMVASVAQIGSAISYIQDTTARAEAFTQDLGVEVPPNLEEAVDRNLVYNQIADKLNLDLTDSKDQAFLFYIIERGSPKEQQKANFDLALADFGFKENKETGRTGQESMLIHNGYFFKGTNHPDYAVYENYQEARLGEYLGKGKEASRGRI